MSGGLLTGYQTCEWTHASAGSIPEANFTYFFILFEDMQTLEHGKEPMRQEILCELFRGNNGATAKAVASSVSPSYAMQTAIRRV